MIALKIEDLRGFTTKLFVRDTFDGLCVREARVATFSSFSIDGRIRPGYYTKDEREAEGIREYAAWRMLRPFCFSLIKGNGCRGAFTSSLPWGRRRRRPSRRKPEGTGGRRW